MIYKLYGDEKGWEMLTVKHELDQVFCILDYLILEQRKECSYLIIEHNVKENSDFPYAILNGGIDEYLSFKEENKEKVKTRV